MLVIDISVLDLSLYAAGILGYNLVTVKEDKTTLGSEPDQPDPPERLHDAAHIYDSR